MFRRSPKCLAAVVEPAVIRMQGEQSCSPCISRFILLQFDFFLFLATMLDNLVNNLCEFLNIDPIEPNSERVYEIVFDGGLNVEITALSNSQVVIRSELATLPDDDAEQESMLRDYLQVNMLLMREQKNSLSLDRDTRKIWLYRMAMVDHISESDFHELVSEFVVTLEWWKKRGSSGPPTSTAADLMPHHFIRP